MSPDNIDIASIVYGIIATVIFTGAVFALRHIIIKSRFLIGSRRVRKRLARQSATTKWLLSRYAGLGSDGLYVTKYVCAGTQIPLYSPTNWHSGTFELDALLDDSNIAKSDTVPKTRILKQFSKYVPLKHPDGTEWNDEVLVARSISAAGTISLGVANYYQFLSSCGALTLETERALSSGPTRTPIRDTFLKSSTDFARCRLGAQIIGANVTTVLQDGDINWVLVQERSTDLAVHPGAHNVAPVFGLLAPSKLQGKVNIHTDLVREYLEEFLGYEDIQYMSHSKRLDPDWYMRVPEAKYLSDQLARKKAEFRVLGVGVDVLNGEVDLACCLVLNLADFRDEMHRMETNWEYRSINLYDLMSSDLDDLVATGMMQTGGIQSLDLARKWVLDR